MKSKNNYIIIVLVIGIALGLVVPKVFKYFSGDVSIPFLAKKISTFTECETGGNEVVEGKYLKRCTLPDGTEFSEGRVIGGYQLPNNIKEVAEGIEVAQPVIIDVGEKGQLKAKFPRIGKYLPVQWGEKYVADVPSCEAVYQTCNEESLYPEEVKSGEAVISIDIEFVNESTDKEMAIDVENMFRYVFDDKVVTPRGRYVSRQISYEDSKNFGPGTFSVPPISSRVHSLLVTVPEEVEEVLLVYGLDLSNPQVALSFQVQDVFAANPLKTKRFEFPYPMSWHEPGADTKIGRRAGAAFMLTGVELGSAPAPLNTRKSEGFGNYDLGEPLSALTLIFRLRMDEKSEAELKDFPSIPLRIMRYVEEDGNMVPSNTSQFQFPDSGGSAGKFGATYNNIKVLFVVPQEKSRFTIYTGDESRIFFEVLLDENGEIQVRETNIG